MLLIKNAEGMHDASVENHGVICGTHLPVAGDIPLKNLYAELRQRRPGTQAARQALPDNGACGLSGTHISTFCQRMEYRRLAGPWATCNDKAKVDHFSTQVRSPRHNAFRWVGCPPEEPRVSLPETRAASCRNMHSLGGQPCTSLARFPSDGMSIKSRLPWRTLPKKTTPRSAPLAPSGHARVTAINVCVRCSLKATSSSLCMKRAPVGTGSPAL